MFPHHSPQRGISDEPPRERLALVADVRTGCKRRGHTTAVLGARAKEGCRQEFARHRRQMKWMGSAWAFMYLYSTSISIKKTALFVERVSRLTDPAQSIASA